MGAGAPQGLSRGARAWIVGAVAVGLIASVYLIFLRIDTQTYRVPSGSMEPTFGINARFTVNKEAYSDADPQRGDIVVVHPPAGALEGRCGVAVGNRLCPKPTADAADVQFVDRVIGLPGERVGVDDGKAVIDGKPLGEPYANLENCFADGCTFRGTITIPLDHYFLMGDNRGASDDSRFWGPVPRDQIVGRVDDCLPLGLRCTEDDRTG